MTILAALVLVTAVATATPTARADPGMSAEPSAVPVSQSPSVSGVASWLRATASFYGPGFYGKRTACGQPYTTTIQGTAHRTLKCGTLVEFRHAGVTVTVPVIDRGPFIAGRLWDLSGATCTTLGHCWTGPIEYRMVN